MSDFDFSVYKLLGNELMVGCIISSSLSSHLFGAFYARSFFLIYGDFSLAKNTFSRYKDVHPVPKKKTNSKRNFTEKIMPESKSLGKRYKEKRCHLMGCNDSSG